MLTLKSKTRWLWCLTMVYVFSINSSATVEDKNVETPVIEKLLIDYFKSLGYEDEELSSRIQSYFGTNDQMFTEYVLGKIDHLKLIYEIFKHYFTDQEILVLIKFNNLPEIKKFNSLWPEVIKSYEQNIDLRLNAIKMAIIQIAKEKQEQG